MENPFFPPIFVRRANGSLPSGPDTRPGRTTTFNPTPLMTDRNPDTNQRVVIFSAPSGAGKSTLIGRMLERFPQLEFAISATSRAPRGTEQNGREYYFLSNEEFTRRVRQGEFVEWEEVYAGTCYGTLRSETERIWAKGHVIVFDVDVRGGINLKRIFGPQALSIFIQPPSVEELRRRLITRATDPPAEIERRVAKAEQELALAGSFDCILINDDLEEAVAEAKAILDDFFGA